MGQGILTTLQQLAAEASGLEFDSLRVVTGDTDLTLFDIGSYASRSTFAIGNAVVDAGKKIKDQIKTLAAAKFAKLHRNVTPADRGPGGSCVPGGRARRRLHRERGGRTRQSIISVRTARR